jgi:hypothetical protein
MSLLDKILGRNKSLTQLSPAELRKKEILIGKAREKLMQKIETLAGDKKRLFEQGKTAPVELRKALAGEFEIKTRQQLLTAREMNVRSKELLTVGRVRMMKESQAASDRGARLNVTERDFVKLTQWITDDTISQEMYVERLDELLAQGESADRDAMAASPLGDAGSEVLRQWERLDRGEVQTDEALSEAERAVRQRATGESS